MLHGCVECRLALKRRKHHGVGGAARGGNADRPRFFLPLTLGFQRGRVCAAVLAERRPRKGDAPTASQHDSATLLSTAGVAPPKAMTAFEHSQITRPCICPYTAQETQREAVSRVDRPLGKHVGRGRPPR